MPLCHAANDSVLGPPSPIRRIRQQYLQQYLWSGGFWKEPQHPRRMEWQKGGPEGALRASTRPKRFSV
jgi:hypothetical protein